MGDFLCKHHVLKDSKAEWCKNLGLNIEHIKGDGNCLYTCLGKALEMDGHQVRNSIVDKSNVHWQDTMAFDLDGEEYINFLSGTSGTQQWGDKWPFSLELK
eukprot:6239484-Heterocapsa_arctica.AAC.1